MRFKLALAGLAATASRVTSRSSDGTLPGKLLTRFQPDAIARLSRRLPQGSVVISGTNGKTTMAAMVAAIAAQAGHQPVRNSGGTNLPSDIATNLAKAAKRQGHGIAGDLGLFEVNELWLPALAGQLGPRVLLLGNLFPDQLHSSSELEAIAQRWASVASSSPAERTFVACADDPQVATIAEAAETRVYYGIGSDWAEGCDAGQPAARRRCHRCGTPYAYDVIHLGHLGLWRCDTCSSGRPKLHVAASEIELTGVSGAAFTLRTAGGAARVQLQMPGLYNVYNALGAAAVGLSLGVNLEVVASALTTVTPSFGGGRALSVGDREMRVLLAKNPASANQVLQTLALEEEPLEVLAILNDEVADGRDVSWIWDADWAPLAPKVGRITCSGTRAADLAVRIKHAGVPAGKIRLVPPVTEGLDAALAHGGGRLFALPNHSAMLALRDILTSRGHVGSARR